EQRQVMLLMRELVLAVEAMHVLGIVHGQLHAGNVLVQGGRVRLTHVSPLLYTDPLEDAAAVVRMMREVLEARGEGETEAGRLAEQAEQQRMTLRQLGAALAVLLDSREESRPMEAAEELTPRGRSLVAALFVALL